MSFSEGLILYDDVEGIFHPPAVLADIVMLESMTIEISDTIGGGIKEDDYFGGVEERLKKFPYSQAFLDVTDTLGVNIPQSITFIKIPDNLMENLLNNYETKKEAYNFLKRHIQKRIGMGVFYALTDENNDLLEHPYPLQEDKQ